MLPVINAFKAAHQLTDVTVVADAGIISEPNRVAIQVDGLSFIVGIRIPFLPNIVQEWRQYGPCLYVDGPTRFPPDLVHVSPHLRVGSEPSTIIRSSCENRSPKMQTRFQTGSNAASLSSRRWSAPEIAGYVHW